MWYKGVSKAFGDSQEMHDQNQQVFVKHCLDSCYIFFGFSMVCPWAHAKHSRGLTDFDWLPSLNNGGPPSIHTNHTNQNEPNI